MSEPVEPDVYYEAMGLWLRNRGQEFFRNVRIMRDEQVSVAEENKIKDFADATDQAWRHLVKEGGMMDYEEKGEKKSMPVGLETKTPEIRAREQLDFLLDALERERMELEAPGFFGQPKNMVNVLNGKLDEYRFPRYLFLTLHELYQKDKEFVQKAVVEKFSKSPDIKQHYLDMLKAVDCPKIEKPASLEFTSDIERAIPPMKVAATPPKPDKR